MKRRRLRSAILYSLLVLVASCGGDDPTEPQTPTGPTNVTMSFAAVSALPGEEVDITGISASVDVSASYMIVRDVGTTAAASGAAATQASAVAPILRRDDGTLYFVAPLKPADPANGGKVELLLGGAGPTSNVVPFTVAPLAPATVTVQDMVGQLQGLMTTWLGVYGTTRDELRTMDPATMPAYLYPLWQAHEVLDSPDNPNSLRATVDGPVPFFDNETSDFDIVNRLLSTTNVVAMLEEEIASIDSLPRQDTVTVTVESLPATSQLSSAVNMCNVPATDYGIDTASRLDIAMEQSGNARSRLAGVRGPDLDFWGNVATTAALVKPLKVGATVISGGLYVWKLVNEAAAQLLPTTFEYDATDFDVADNDFEYNEDDTGGFWRNLRVTAISQGWTLDPEAIGRIASLGNLGGLELPDVLEDELTEFQSDLIAYAITQATKLLIDQSTNGGAVLEVCPGVWRISDGMSSSLFSESEIVTGTSFRMSSHTFFETVEPGEAQLEVRTKPGRFGKVFPTKKIKDIEVKAIEVEVTPSSVTMKDDQEVSFDAVVKNSSDDRVDWFVPAPLIEVRRENFDKTIVIKAPPQGTKWESEILKARSLANTGAREGKVQSDPREGVAAINHEDSVTIVIDPGYKCLSNGDPPFTFEAIVKGTDDYNVIWKRVSGFGTLNSNGVYTPPGAGVTDDVISAEVEGKPNAIAYAHIKVGACICHFEINTFGLVAEGGDVAYGFANLPNGFHSYQFFFELQQVGVPDGVSFAMNLGPTNDGPAPLPYDIGLYPIGVAYVSASGTWTTKDSTVIVLLDITEHTDTHIVGTFSGMVANVDDVTIPVSGSIRAGRMNPGWPCSE